MVYLFQNTVVFYHRLPVSKHQRILRPNMGRRDQNAERRSMRIWGGRDSKDWEKVFLNLWRRKFKSSTEGLNVQVLADGGANAGRRGDIRDRV